MSKTGWRAGLFVAALASGLAWLLQNVLRDAWQIRTLPEQENLAA